LRWHLLRVSPMGRRNLMYWQNWAIKSFYIEDISDHLPKPGQMDAADSISLVHRLVRQWAENELLVEAAEFNLTDRIG